MKESVRVALRLSELRQQINDFDQEAGETSALDAMTSEYRKHGKRVQGRRSGRGPGPGPGAQQQRRGRGRNAPDA